MGAIGGEYAHVASPEPDKISPALCGEFWDDLDPRHLAVIADQTRHHGREPAGARANLQHAMPGCRSSMDRSQST
jgi:hypothetical protein